MKTQKHSSNEGQYMLPLFSEINFGSPEPSEKPKVIEKKRRKRVKVKQKECLGGDFTNPSLEFIRKSHLYLLDYSVKQLSSSKTSLSSRQEIFDWIVEDIHSSNPYFAYSFNACCLASGYNPKVFIDSIEEELLFMGLHPYKRSNKGKHRLQNIGAYDDEDF